MNNIAPFMLFSHPQQAGKHSHQPVLLAKLCALVPTLTSMVSIAPFMLFSHPQQAGKHSQQPVLLAKLCALVPPLTSMVSIAASCPSHTHSRLGNTATSLCCWPSCAPNSQH